MAKSKERIDIEIGIAKDKADQSLRKLLADIEGLGSKPIELDVKRKLADATGRGEWGVEDYLKNLQANIREALRPTSPVTGAAARSALEVGAGSGRFDKLAAVLSEVTGASKPEETYQKVLKKYADNSERVEKKLAEDERKKAKKDDEDLRKKEKSEVHDKEKKSIDEIKTEVKKGFEHSVKLAYQVRGFNVDHSVALSPMESKALLRIEAAAVAFRDIGEKGIAGIKEFGVKIGERFKASVIEPVKKAGEYIAGAVRKVTDPIGAGIKKVVERVSKTGRHLGHKASAYGDAFKTIGAVLWRGKAPAPTPVEPEPEPEIPKEPTKEEGYGGESSFSDYLEYAHPKEEAEGAGGGLGASKGTIEAILASVQNIEAAVKSGKGVAVHATADDDDDDEETATPTKKSRGWLKAVGAGAAGFGLGAWKVLNPFAAFKGSGKKKSSYGGGYGYGDDDDDDDDDIFPSKAKKQVKQGFNIFSSFLLADTRKWKDWFGDAFDNIKKGIDKVSNMFAVKLITAPARLLISGAKKVATKIGDIIGGAVDTIKSIGSDIMGGVFLGMGINMTASPGGILNSLFDAGSRRLERAKESREGRRDIALRMDKLQKEQAALYGDGRMDMEAIHQMQALKSELDDLNFKYAEVSDTEKDGEQELANLSTGWQTISDTIGRFVLEAQMHLMPLFESVQGYIAEKLPSALAFITTCVKNPSDAFALLCDAGNYAIEALKNILLYFFTDYAPKIIGSFLQWIWDGFTKFNWGGVIKSWVAYFGEGFFEIELLGLSMLTALGKAAGQLGKQFINLITGKGFDFSKLGEALVEGFNEVEQYDWVKSTRAGFKNARENVGPTGIPTMEIPAWERQESEKEQQLREKMSDSLSKITDSDEYKNSEEHWKNVFSEFQAFNKREQDGANRELNQNDVDQIRQNHNQSANFESAASSWSRIASSIGNKQPPEVKAVKDLQEETRKDAERRQKAEERAQHSRDESVKYLAKMSGGVPAVLG